MIFGKKKTVVDELFSKISAYLAAFMILTLVLALMK